MRPGERRVVVTWTGNAGVRTCAMLERTGRWRIEEADVFTEMGTGEPTFERLVLQGPHLYRRMPVVLLDLEGRLLAKPVTVPQVRTRKRRAILEGELRRALPVELDEVAWDSIVMEADAIEEKRILFAASQDERPGRFRFRCERGYRSMRWEALPIALYNIWQAVGDPAPVVLAYPVGDSLISWFLGGGVSLVRVHRWQKPGGKDARFEHLRGEWTRSIAAVSEAQAEWRPESVQIVGGDAQGISAAVGELPGGVPVRALSMAEMCAELPIDGVDRLPEKHLIAVAGSLLGECGEPFLRGSLRSAADRIREEERTSSRWNLAAAGGVVVAGVLWWLPAWQDLQRLETVLEDHRAQRRPVAALAEELDAVLSKVDVAEKRIHALTELARSRANWSNFLVDLQTRLGEVENVWIDSLEIVRSAGGKDSGPSREDSSGAWPHAIQLRLQGRLLDPANPMKRASPEMRNRVSELIEGLTASDFIEGVSGKRFESLTGGLMSFEFMLTINPERRL